MTTACGVYICQMVSFQQSCSGGSSETRAVTFLDTSSYLTFYFNYNLLFSNIVWRTNVFTSPCCPLTLSSYSTLSQTAFLTFPEAHPRFISSTSHLLFLLFHKPLTGPVKLYKLKSQTQQNYPCTVLHLHSSRLPCSIYTPLGSCTKSTARCKHQHWYYMQ